VRKTRDDHAGEATHAAKYHELRRIGMLSPDYLPCNCTAKDGIRRQSRERPVLLHITV
jgi:hypothetical protein